MRYRKIPDETIRRLPVYLRGVLRLGRGGVVRASSKQLADLTGIAPWQIRKDFSYFGGFGKPGVGYDLRTLARRINKILRLDTGHKAVLVGVGNLGSALLAYPSFGTYGFKIVAAFDIDRRKIGRRKAGVLIEDWAALGGRGFCGVHLGIIAVPQEAAQAVVDALLTAGIRGILSFSPRHLVVPRRVKVITIDIAMDLARLPYYLSGSHT